MSGNWNRSKIAKSLGLSSKQQKIELIDFALAALETSPLLKDTIPNLTKKSPRKRDDYKCGHCGMIKRNHSCAGGGGEGGQEDDSYCGGGSGNKRKKFFKPLTVLLLDNLNVKTQEHLKEIQRFGEDKIEVNVRPVSGPRGMFKILAEASWSNNQVCIGHISDDYKEIVKGSIEDNTLQHAELTPLQEVYNSEIKKTVLRAQLTIYRNTSWRTKRLSEIEWINMSNKKYKTECGSSSHSESDPPSPPQQPISQTYSPSSIIDPSPPSPPQQKYKPSSPLSYPISGVETLSLSQTYQSSSPKSYTIPEEPTNIERRLVQDMLTTPPLFMSRDFDCRTLWSNQFTH